MKMTEPRTSNLERRTSNADARGGGSALGVGCWMLGVSPAHSEGIKIKNQAFTLIEVLLAVGIFAIVLFAINTVFFSALKLERAVSRSVDERAPLNQALAILRRDLQGAAQPMTNSYVLTRDFVIGASGGGLGSAQSASLEFYTTTGVINDEVPWGDLQKVRYELVEPAQRTNSNSRELVRIITRNVLATTTVEEDEQFLAGGIESVEFMCYNGTDWRSSWDTAAGDFGLPLAVRVRIQLALDNPAGNMLREPLEMLVPITTQALTNQTGEAL